MTKYFVLTVFLLLIFFSLVGFLHGPQSKLGTKRFQIGSATAQVEIAASMFEQIQGLSGRSSLCPDCGMLFVYQKARPMTFWMKGMEFSLDMIFIRSARVVEIVPDVPVPDSRGTIPTVRSQEDADQVLEMNAGYAAGHGIKVGDSVQLQ